MGSASDLQRVGGRAQLCPRDGASDRQEPGQGPRRSNIMISTIGIWLSILMYVQLLLQPTCGTFLLFVTPIKTTIAATAF